MYGPDRGNWIALLIALLVAGAVMMGAYLVGARSQEPALRELRGQLDEAAGRMQALNDLRTTDQRHIQELRDAIKVYNLWIGDLNRTVNFWKEQKMREVEKRIDR